MPAPQHTPPARTSTAPRLTLVIPCFNEAPSLPRLVQRLRETLVRADTEVILVDNGSSDDTPNALASLLSGEPRLRSLRVERNQGYGHGILAGLGAARGEILGWTHADLQTDPADALRALALFDADPTRALFVKGRRGGRALGDQVFSVGMSLFETLLLREAFWDINAQPTLFPRAFFDTWQDPPHDFALDLFAYHAARRAGMTVRRFPVTFGPRAHGASHWNVSWSSKARFIRRTVDYSLRLHREIRGGS